MSEFNLQPSDVIWKRRILAPAIQYGDYITLIGIKYNDPYMQQQLSFCDKEELEKHKPVEGFIDNKYNFIPKEEANELEIDNGFVLLAACRYGDYITAVGVRHYDLHMHQQLDLCDEDELQERRRADVVSQGFIDRWGNYLSREEALTLVKDTKQMFSFRCQSGCDDVLYSEGIH